MADVRAIVHRGSRRIHSADRDLRGRFNPKTHSTVPDFHEPYRDVVGNFDRFSKFDPGVERMLPQGQRILLGQLKFQQLQKVRFELP